MTDEQNLEPDEESAALGDDKSEPDAGGEELEPDRERLGPDADDGDENGEPSTQALLAALEREHGRHAKAIAKATGTPLEELHACPTCEGVGFTPEPIEAPPPLVQDPTTETCSRCAGNGTVKTGATDLGHPTKACGLCGGSGYIQREEYPEAGAGFGNGSGTVSAPVAVTPASTSSDPEVEILRARGYTVLEPIVVPN